MLASGDPVKGQVVDVGENSEDIGYVVVAYQYEGRDYKTKNVTEGAVQRGNLAVGDLLDIVVDPQEPTRAFVVRLFVD